MITYKVRTEGVYKGQAVPAKFYYTTSICMNRNGNWQAVLSWAPNCDVGYLLWNRTAGQPLTGMPRRDEPGGRTKDTIGADVSLAAVNSVN